MANTKTYKAGNSIGLIIPKKIAEKYNVDIGTKIFFEQSEKGILLKPIDDDKLSEVVKDLKYNI